MPRRLSLPTVTITAIKTASLRQLITAATVGTIAAASFVASSTGTPEDTVDTTSPSSTSSSTSSPSSTPPTSSSTSPSRPSDTDGSEGGEGGRPLPTGKLLGLGDFFLPEGGYDSSRRGWEENRYDVAGRDQVQGIANTISGCSARSAKVLELRLKNSFSQLAFSVGQSDGSDSSSQNVTVEVQANNSQVEIQRVPFNQVQNFTVPVTGVNALQILVYLDSEVQGCGSGSVVAVMTDATLS